MTDGIDPTVFDVEGLQRALDVRRRERGLSWRQVATQIWDMSSELNRTSLAHPISPSTLSGMRPTIVGGVVVFVLAWLEMSPESFVPVAAGGAYDAPLPAVRPDRRLRWNLPRLYEAMDAEREKQGLSWRTLAERLDVSSAQLTGLRTAKYGATMKVSMRITGWLRRPAADFIDAADY